MTENKQVSFNIPYRCVGANPYDAPPVKPRTTSELIALESIQRDMNAREAATNRLKATSIPDNIFMKLDGSEYRRRDIPMINPLRGSALIDPGILRPPQVAANVMDRIGTSTYGIRTSGSVCFIPSCGRCGDNMFVQKRASTVAVNCNGCNASIIMEVSP